MMERLVLQTFVLKERKSYQMEHVRLAQLSQELPQTIEVVLLRYALLDKSSKSMDVALNAIHTPELTLKVRFVSHTTVMTDKNLVQMGHALTAQIMKEPKELVLHADLINVTSDKEFREMVLVSTVSYSMLFAATEDAAQSQLASQW